MASRDDDLTWLYRDQQPADETRVDQSPVDDEPAPKSSSAESSPRRRMTFVDNSSDLPPRRMSFVEDERTPAAPRVTNRTSTPTVRPQPAPRPQTPHPPSKTKRRRPALRILLTVVVVLALFAVYLVAVPMMAWNNAARVDAMPTGQRPPEQPGKVYLLVGSDGREKLSRSERARLGTGNAEGKRTDTMLMLVVPKTGKPALISLPRDSYVEIPGHRKNKLNAAYAFGGPQLLVQTVEHNTGVRIDEYVEIGFGGFATIIDALGGIDMCLDKPIKDRDSHIDLPAGCQLMDGKTALGYVRMRKADPTGDIGRMKRQREMMGAMMKKAASPSNVLIPTRYWKLSHAAAGAVAVDRDTSVWDAAGMAKALLGVTRGGLTLVVPIADTNASTSAGSSILWDKKKAKEMFGKIAQGDTTGLEKFSKK